MNKEYIYRNVSGKWLQINPNAGESAKVLADHLTELQIVIDDDCQFCRIIRYYDEYKKTITYRAYSMSKITITITKTNYD